MWETSRGGSEHGFHVTFAIGPPSPVPDRCDAEISYIEWALHRQVGVVPLVHLMNRDIKGDGVRGLQGKVLRFRRRVESANRRDEG